MAKKIVALVVALIVAVAGLGIAVYASQADDSVEFVNSGKDYEISFKLRDGAEKFRLFAVLGDEAQDKDTNEYLYKSDYVDTTINGNEVTVASDVVFEFLNSLKKFEKFVSFDKVQIGALCFDEDGVAVKDKAIGATQVPGIVKLMPKDADSTAMIERNGIVETYNEGLTTAKDGCYGVTSIIEAYDNKYQQDAEYDTADYNQWFVYGLKIGIKVNELDNYVTVANGTYKVFASDGTKELTENANPGTGSIIRVYDKDNKIVEEFYIVIFGDVDGNAFVNVTDRTKLIAEVSNRIWSISSKSTYVPYLFRAGNLDQNNAINVTDRTKLISGVSNNSTINQITGRTK